MLLPFRSFGVRRVGVGTYGVDNDTVVIFFSFVGLGRAVRRSLVLFQATYLLLNAAQIRCFEAWVPSGCSSNGSQWLASVLVVYPCSRWDSTWHVMVVFFRSDYSECVAVHWWVVRCLNVIILGFAFLV